jgi:TRAP-type C4-dicarboxylate transport system permease small subunit
MLIVIACILVARRIISSTIQSASLDLTSETSIVKISLTVVTVIIPILVVGGAIAFYIFGLRLFKKKND